MIIGIVEKEGIARARDIAKESEVVIRVVDGGEENDLKEGLTDLVDLGENSDKVNGGKIEVLTLINKVDRYPRHLGSEKNPELNDENIIPISVTEHINTDKFITRLTQIVKRQVYSDTGDTGRSITESALVTRSRHRVHVLNALEALERFEKRSETAYDVDLAAEELRIAAEEIGSIVGRVGVEDILDTLFRDFCIGK